MTSVKKRGMRARIAQWQDTPEARIAALSAVPYFAGLGEADLRALARGARLLRVATGESVFQEGDVCRGLHVIATGRAKVVKLSVEGREHVLHAEPKGTLGEAPLFDGEPYPASALALEPSVLLFLPKRTVLAWCRKRPEVAIGIVQALAHRMHRFAALAEGLQGFEPTLFRGKK